MPDRSDAVPVGPPPLTLGDYARWLRRLWWIPALVAAIGIAAAVALTAAVVPAYTAKAVVLIQPGGINPSSTRINLDTEAQVLRSLVVADQARLLMNTQIPAEQLLTAVDVSVPPNSQVLSVSFTAASPELARDGAQSFAQAHLDVRTESARTAVEAQIGGIRQQIDDAAEQLAEAAAQLAVAPAGSVEEAQANADRTILTQQLSDLNQQLSPLLTTAPTSGAVLSNATLPRFPSAPSWRLNLVSGFALGILSGLVLALVVDRLDTRIRRSRDIPAQAGLEVVAEAPGPGEGACLLPAAHPIARELSRTRRLLVDRAWQRTPGARARVLLVCATGSRVTATGEAAGFVAGNVAASLARTGNRVAVVVANAHSPIARMFGVDAPRGLVDVLRGDLPAVRALQPVPSLPGLEILLPGELDPDVELSIPGLRSVLQQLAATVELVVIETRPPGSDLEAEALAGDVGSALLIVETEHARRKDVLDAAGHLARFDAPVLGAVLVPGLGPVPTASPTAPARSDGASDGDVEATMRIPSVPDTNGSRADVDEAANRTNRGYLPWPGRTTEPAGLTGVRPSPVPRGRVGGQE